MSVEESGMSEGALPPELAATPPAQSPTIGEVPAATTAAVDAAQAAPKGPTRAEKHEAALAKQKEKWDKLIAESNSKESDSEIPAESEPAAADAGGEGNAADGATPATGDDAADRRRLAAEYGVSVEQLAGFTSVKDAAEALRLRDLELFNGNGRQPQGQQPPPAEPPAKPADGQPTAEQRQLAKKLGFDLSEWEEDESVRKNFELVEAAIAERDGTLTQLQERIQAIEFEASQRETAQRVQVFHQTLDGLNPERYGTAESQTPEQSAMRAYLAQQVEIAADNLEAQGIQPPRDVAAFTRRVERAIFGAAPKANNARAAEEPKPTPTPPRPQLGPPGRSTPRSKSPGRRVSDLKSPEEVDSFLEETFNHLVEKSATGY